MFLKNIHYQTVCLPEKKNNGKNIMIYISPVKIALKVEQIATLCFFVFSDRR